MTLYRRRATYISLEEHSKINKLLLLELPDSKSPDNSTTQDIFSYISSK